MERWAECEKDRERQPLIVTGDPESAIKVFEDMGFEKRHMKTDIEGGANVSNVLKDQNGNTVIVTKSETIPRDLTGISINVDDFQEAYDFLLGHGFINPRGDRVTETSTSRATMLFAPSGYPVSISEHLKDND
ncbi:MAG: hypothetical protein IJL78_06115 [Lachnospiraceae bacterium]|nr:hypothetical protein [Lachnospiraceae bacterium]